MIQFVYFDLGKVLVDFSHEQAAQQLAELAGCPASRVFALLFETSLQRRYERGELDTFELCDELRERLGFVASQSEICRAISDIFQPVEAVQQIAQRLRNRGMRLGLLSNTCEAHWEQVTTTTTPWLQPLMDVVLLSFEVGTSKPDPEIYRQAIRWAGVPAGNIFFCDDREENVVAAVEAGITARLFQTAERLELDLQELGIL